MSSTKVRPEPQFSICNMQERLQLTRTECAGIDFVQEKFLGAGPQDNESAIEQAKDEHISDCELLPFRYCLRRGCGAASLELMRATQSSAVNTSRPPAARFQSRINR